MNAKTLTAAIVAVASAVLLTACANPQHQTGDAAPAGSAVPTTPAPTSAVPTSALPTSALPTSALPTTVADPVAATKSPVPDVIGPNGYRGINLGMSEQEVVATGKAKPFDDYGPGCRQAYRNGDPKQSGMVIVDKDLGVVLIEAGSASTPEGLHRYSTTDDLQRIYPDLRSDGSGPIGYGRFYVTVRGNAQAQWRIDTKGTVVSLMLVTRATSACIQ